jgi:putative ABC transport system permease protein
MVHSVDLSDGRYFSDLDEQGVRDVIVVGANVAEQLFPFEDPIGKQVRLRGRKFRVIGIFVKEGEGSEGASSADNVAHMPLATFGKHWGTRWRNVSVQAKLIEGTSLEDAKDEMTGVLRVARGLDAKEADNFALNEQQSLREQIEPIKTAIYAIGIGLTALALLVGGIGVMNIMFVTVKERTREIGIRKAVGARRRTILIQFLIEAVVICMVGGLIGVGLSIPLSMVISLILPSSLDFQLVVLAFSICVAIGTIFGLAPAWTAANSVPIEALRYE